MTAFNSALSQAQGLGPTLTKQNGTVNYTGAAKLDTFDATQNVNGFVVADLNMRLNFDAGTLSGTADNIAGEIDGMDRTLAGTLSTANTNSPNLIAEATTQVPVVGSVTNTSILANMRGDLTDSVSNQQATFELSLQGPMFGPNAEASAGAAVALVGNSSQVGFAFGGGGQYHLNRQ